MGKLLIVISISFFVVSELVAQSLEDATYTTPTTWSQNFSSNGIVKSTREHLLGGGVFKFSLNERYKLNATMYEGDSTFYQYINTSYTDLQLGSGTVDINLFMRLAQDLDGDSNRVFADNDYYFNDLLNIESQNLFLSPRVYQGNVKFNNVIEGTSLTIGRQYISHINAFQLDGVNAEASILNDVLTFFVYGGLPVSFFIDTRWDYLVGGGVEYNPLETLKMRIEYIYSDIIDTASHLVKVRTDWRYDYGLVYAEYGNDNGKNFYELGSIFTYNPTKTKVVIEWEHLVDEIGDSKNYYSSPLAYALTPYGRYIKPTIRVQQGITDFLLAGVGIEYKDAYGEENLDNRDYLRYFTNIDLVAFPFDNLYLSLIADYWDVQSTQYTKSNNELTFGADLNYGFTENISAWLGTHFNRYVFDSYTGEYKDWVRTYYMGVQWEINSVFALTTDFTYENSQILERDVSSDYTDNFIFQLWLNISI